MSRILGVDLGQVQDFTAFVVGDWVPVEVGRPVLEVPYLRRFRGRSYTAVADEIEALMCWPSMAGAELVVDASGVGRPVTDLLRERPACRGLHAVTITGGQAASTEGRDHHVPKRDLVGGVQVLLQSGRLKIASGFPETAVLRAELNDFQVSISDSGSASYAASGSRHDDLVLALSLVAWQAARGGQGQAFIEHFRRMEARGELAVRRTDWAALTAQARARRTGLVAMPGGRR